MKKYFFYCLVSILLLLALIQSVFFSKNFSEDSLLISYLHQHPLPPGIFKLFYLITVLANTETVLAGLIILLFLTFWKKKARYEVALLTLNMGIAAIIEAAFKQHFGRSRPHGVLGNYHLTTYSFPSGHAMLAVCFYGLLFYFLAKYFPQHHQPIQWIAFLTALLIGSSRFLIGVHYLSDVLGGALVAIPILCLGIYLYSLKRIPRI